MTPASSRSARAWLLGWLVLGLGLLQGCATTQNPDPLEPMNRKVFAFNDKVDEAVLQPVAKGYKAVAPEAFRTAVSNFRGNFRDVWSAINLFLQGRPGDGVQQIMRVSVNTTLGLGGLIDIATPMRLYRQPEDFGQTLGVWGVGPGAYIVWPLLGPSTARDSLSIPGDMYFSPSRVISDNSTSYGLSVLTVINARAAALDVTDLLGDVALDRYAFTRDFYLQRRQSLIHRGTAADAPDSDEVPPGQDDFLDDEPLDEAQDEVPGKAAGPAL